MQLQKLLEIEAEKDGEIVKTGHVKTICEQAHVRPHSQKRVERWIMCDREGHEVAEGLDLVEVLWHYI